MTRLSWFFGLMLLALLIAACGPELTPTPTPDAKATETRIAANIYATQTASVPTATDTPADTNTPLPTDTPTVTDTPRPTDTVQPTTAANAEVVVTSTLDTGWTLYEMQTSKFALALPPGWQRLDLNPGAMDASLSVVGEKNPNFQTMFSSQYFRSLVASGIRFYALDLNPDSITAIPPNTANVIKLNVGAAFPLDSLVQLSLTQLQKLADPSVPVTHRRVTLSNIQAEEIDYASKITLPTGESTLLRLVQYVMIDGTTEYVVTVGGDNARNKNSGPLWAKIGQSFRLLK